MIVHISLLNCLTLWHVLGLNFQLQRHCVDKGTALPLMSIPPAKPRRRPSAPSPPVVLPDELIADILSRLTVKPLMRLRCVSKSWNTLISDPTFISMHLHRSKRNPHLTLMWEHRSDRVKKDRSVVPFPVSRLLENLPTTVPDDPCYRLNDNDCHRLVGSCNGLLCLHGYSSIRGNWFCFWNPATRITSEKFWSFSDFKFRCPNPLKFSFGYDKSTGTYKVVAFRVYSDKDDAATRRSVVNVFSLGDNTWRNIQSFPAVPIEYILQGPNNGVYFSGTLNWMALRGRFRNDYYYYGLNDVTVEQFVIVSLDLSTESYTELLLPGGFDDVPRVVPPSVGVLMDCICFSHVYKGTDFVIWQMKEFGVQESWTQFLRISYQNLQRNLQMDDDMNGLKRYFSLLPLCVSENGDTLLLAKDDGVDAILYNWRDNRVSRTNITNQLQWFFAKDYVESLASFP